MSAVDLRFGDCLAVLRSLPDASVDAVCTDPPYGLSNLRPAQVTAAVVAWSSGDREHVPDARGFMGRDWDAFVPPPAVWDECLRVLKPGGHLACFSAPRTMDLMGLSIRLAGFEIRDGLTWLHGQGFPKGANTQLKPAQEPIVLARKPLIGTVAANVLAHGTGGLNVDATRTAGAKPDTTRGASVKRSSMEGGELGDQGRILDDGKGRWPTNVLFTHSPECADECVPGCPVAELDAQSGKVGAAAPVRGTEPSAAVESGTITGARARVPGAFHGDSGGASRFFPTFRYQAKAPTRERPKIDGQGHPTVKPLALMAWLVRLLCPPGGVVLDPFAGTGTTLAAARDEGFDCIGVERWDLAYRLACQRLGLPDELPEPVLDVPPPVAPVLEVVPEPEPEPVDPILVAISECADEPAALALYHAHVQDWTDEHTAAVTARLPELRRSA